MSLRIVLVMLDPPLPFGRAMGRWFYALLRGLVARGHRVSAFAICSSEEEKRQVLTLFPAPEYDLRCYVPTPRTGLAARLNLLRRPFGYVITPELRHDVETQLASGYDLLHLEVLWVGWLGLGDPDRSILNVPYLLELDLSDQSSGSLKQWLLKQASTRAEHSILRRFPHVLAVSPRLAARIRQISPRSSVEALPFAMDLSLYPFDEAGPTNSGPPTVGLIASYRWTPGLTAGLRLLERLWPEVKRQVPEARLIVGGYGASEVFAAHVGRPDVTIVDGVTDVPGFFRSLDLLLYAPNRSSGMKFKVLEAFSFGVPVVTTTDGVEGIEAIDGIHAGVCEDDQGLVERAVALLRDPNLRCQRRLAARALVEATCGPETVLDRLEQVYQSLPATPPMARSTEEPIATST